MVVISHPSRGGTSFRDRLWGACRSEGPGGVFLWEHCSLLPRRPPYMVKRETLTFVHPGEGGHAREHFEMLMSSSLPTLAASRAGSPWHL